MLLNYPDTINRSKIIIVIFENVFVKVIVVIVVIFLFVMEPKIVPWKVGPYNKPLVHSQIKILKRIIRTIVNSANWCSLHSLLKLPSYSLKFLKFIQSTHWEIASIIIKYSPMFFHQMILALFVCFKSLATLPTEMMPTLACHMIASCYFLHSRTTIPTFLEPHRLQQLIALIRVLCVLELSTGDLRVEQLFALITIVDCAQRTPKGFLGLRLGRFKDHLAILSEAPVVIISLHHLLYPSIAHSVELFLLEQTLQIVDVDKFLALLVPWTFQGVLIDLF